MQPPHPLAEHDREEPASNDPAPAAAAFIANPTAPEQIAFSWAQRFADEPEWQDPTTPPADAA